MSGSAAVLQDPNTAVLTKKVAERYFGNWQQVLDQAFAFLEVDNIELAPVLQKVGADDWREDVENYKELEQAVQQTNYAAWLN